MSRFRIQKIISGGQTGADRAALDFAIAHGIPHGGWCPRGRRAEDGVIPARYQLSETPSDDPAQRTEWNVRDSDATVLFSLAPVLRGGSRLTFQVAEGYSKPWLHLSQERDGLGAALTALREFLEEYRPECLNVAGPRASQEPEVGGFVARVMDRLREKI